MKSKVIGIKKNSWWIRLSLVFLLFFSIAFYAVIAKQENKQEEKENSCFSVSKIQWKEPTVNTNTKPKEKEVILKKEPYQNMPRTIKDYPVIGELVIPKIDLRTYILEETNSKTLNTSVTKLEGPEVNEIGNLCITGHNYLNSKMFGKLKKLELGDEISIIDPYDREIKYQVYEITKVVPEDVSCVNQETGGEREVTLITCTIGAIQRLVVKCVEVYD